jgi:Uma2 family endonuclease
MRTGTEPLLTTDDLIAIPEDNYIYELIAGKIYKSDWPFVSHQTVIGNLIMVLSKYYYENRVGQFWPSLGVVFSKYDSVIPDIAFVRAERLAEIVGEEYIAGAPDLVIEVLTPGAEYEDRDRIIKRQLYGKFGVKEYWIVDYQARNIELYLLEGQSLKLNAFYNEQDQLTSSVLSGFRCKVEDVVAT